MVDSYHDIKALLIRVMKQHCLLSATGADLRDWCGTALLEVNTRQDGLLFDELIPAGNNRGLGVGHAIRLAGQLDGVELDFTTRIAPHGRRDNPACFRAQWPTRIRYQQRRNDFRVEADLRATLDPGVTPMREVDVLDLSIGGIAFSLADDANPVLSGVCECLVHLPDESIPTEIELRSTRALPASREVRIGARFTRLEPTARTALERYIARAQRAQIRNSRVV